MTYCGRCGKELPEGTNYCPVCGFAVNGPNFYSPRPQPNYQYYQQEETGTVAWGILSFILTITTGIGGLILCLILYGCGKPKGGFAALIGMLLTIVVGIIGLIIFFAAAASNSSSIIDLVIG